VEEVLVGVLQRSAAAIHERRREHAWRHDTGKADMSTRAGLILIFVCGLVWLPLLFNKMIYWDDWAWFWIFWVKGPTAVMEAYLQASHLEYLLPVPLAFAQYAGIVGRVLAIACHFADAFLVYVIVRKIDTTAKLAVWITALYMLSPCYYVRGYLIQFRYDAHLLFYLLSVWLMWSEHMSRRALAFVCFVLSIGVETLVFLEPLRLVLMYSKHRNWYAAVKSCAPFWLLAAVFVLARVFLLQPSGHYAAYNQMYFSIWTVLVTLGATWYGYLLSAWFTIESAYRLMGGYGLALLGIVLLATVQYLNHPRRAIIDAGRADLSLTLKRILFGAILALSGSLPYLLIRRCSFVYSQSSRFSFVSVLGISICLAALAASIPNRFLRLYCFTALLILLSLCSLQVNKWFLYEAMVDRDLLMQLDRTLSPYRDDPPLVILRMVPETDEIRVLRRHVSIYDFNVPLNLLRDPTWPLVFVHHNAKGPPRPDCSVIGHTLYPCPKHRLLLEYRLNPDKNSVDKMSYLELLKAVFKAYRSPPGMGVLGPVAGSAGPGQSKRYHERPFVSLRKGGEIVANILGIEPSVRAP